MDIHEKRAKATQLVYDFKQALSTFDMALDEYQGELYIVDIDMENPPGAEDPETILGIVGV